MRPWVQKFDDLLAISGSFLCIAMLAVALWYGNATDAALWMIAFAIWDKNT